MRAYIGVTDGDWYRFLAARGAREVNFWQPSGGRRFGAIPPGAPFLFKTHYADGNRIVGAGTLSGWASLPLSQAWDFFREGNGCSTWTDMRQRIGKYRGRHDDGRPDPEIGCIMLRDVEFFRPDEAPPAPPGWSGNIVPVLQAAHIRPVSVEGENRVDNGLLLRSDVHTLFDRGYLGVHPERKTLLVIPRLRAEWGTGIS